LINISPGIFNILAYSKFIPTLGKDLGSKVFGYFLRTYLQIDKSVDFLYIRDIKMAEFFSDFVHIKEY
jgi:hypothetical protein